jgi:3-oxoadipate enol-lactonase
MGPPTSDRRSGATAGGLYVEEAGPVDAPVVVLVNSLATSLRMWDAQVPDLVQRFRVVRYDMRGHGSSAAPAGAWTIDDLGADLLDVLDHVGMRSASVCGLSLGGMVAMWVAAHAPARVERLVLCATGTHFAAGHWQDRIGQVQDGGMSAVAAATAARWFTPGFQLSHPAEVARFADMIEGTSPEGYLGCCAAMDGMDLRPVLPAITAPTLVVSGSHDLGASPWRSEAIATDIAAGGAAVSTTVVEDAAHLVNVEKPKEFSRLLADHLAPSG